MKFIIQSEFGELLDLAMHLQNEGHEVLWYVTESQYSKIGEGILPKVKTLVEYMGKGYIWIIDGCANGRMQDLLREKGEFVFGGSEAGDKLENDRQLGQKLFKMAGFIQPISKNFKDFESAIGFVKKNIDKKWILKQNGDASKSLNHMGKFDGNIDMIFHLESLKKRWNESEYGDIDFDLMEIVEGLEIACSAFFNGQDFLRNKEGKVVGFLNFEEKKECDGGLGETTGETGTTFIGCTEDNQLFKEIMMKPKILEAIRAAKFRGVFDINCIKTDKGIVALEPTCRFGVPATSYEFIEGMITPTAELISIIAKGENQPIEIKEGVGMVMVVMAKPYPLELDVDDEATSIGEKLWILDNGSPIEDFTDEQKKHIHLENFKFESEEDKEKGYFVATKNGYLLTVTGSGETISDVRESLIEYIKNNIYISGQKYRTDIGKRVEKYTGGTKEKRLQGEYNKKIKELEKQHQDELSKIKSAIKNTIYG